MKAWYAVHTYSGHENKVKTNIERRAESLGLKERITQILVPVEEEIRNRTRVIDPDRSTPGHPVLKDGLSVAYNWAHQIFPRLYLSHALEHSGFPR